ncbi:hypothetical protein EJ08DRAFT_651766 [Tothia fuscella]|uniref:Uncharacterized protein n=1 Tax=Tothia fuscella TaxID=1048955 RepID=A0A9P4NLQ7_9PEZI|nr:hypothetical protein EJ08DRAFT_651766 [Tothia fuscella]
MAISAFAREAEAVQPVSSHVSDPSLRPFLQASFDPAEYLNNTLPSLSITSQPVQGRPSTSSPPVPLSELSSQTQTLLSQLNAQASRLNTILTQLTDDILRCGGRLAYEVEVLRGEAVGLSDTLNGGIHDDISRFKPSIVPDASSASVENVEENAPSNESTNLEDSTYITQLRTFAHVRQRLDTVVKVFGEAMQWALPPSEVSQLSSFISMSGPEPGADSQSREEKGQEFAERLRIEVADMIVTADSTEAGHKAASERIRALMDLAMVWKGTAEEKARVRFVEGLAKLAEARLRELDRELSDERYRSASPRKGLQSSRTVHTEKGKGFLDGLLQIQQSK